MNKTTTETKEEANDYVCPHCGHKDTKKFNPCPACKNPVGWDD